MNPEISSQIKEIALDTLKKFESISNQAAGLLNQQPVNPATAIIADTPDNFCAAIQNATNCIAENRRGYSTLKFEPAISRIVTRNINSGEIKIYYITRGVSLPGVNFLASYYSPIGRLASLDIYEEVTVKNGTVELLEKSQLRPQHGHNGWDSINTIIENDNFETITVKSLLALLAPQREEIEIEDILSALEAEDADRDNIIQGKVRTIITKMELRDQPILDKFQDEIFRLPLNMRLFLSGPPGTGKTTTLIRRLGQKLNYEYLEEEEQRLINRYKASFNEAHDRSWIMFTPTELLQQYLREAFARERVPAPDSTIRTWDNYRLDLSRNKLNILQTQSKKTIFVLKKNVSFLTDETISNLIKMYNDFDKWQKIQFLQEISELYNRFIDITIPDNFILEKNITTETNRRFKIFKGKINKIVLLSQEQNLIDFFIETSQEEENARFIFTHLKKYTDSKVKGFLNQQLNKNKTFLNEFARFLDSIKKNQSEGHDADDDFVLDELEDDTPKTPQQLAIDAYKSAIREYSRLKAAGQSVKSGSQRKKILEWLGDRIPDSDECTELGQILQTQEAIHRISRPLNRYIKGIPKRYKEFRRMRQREETWYTDVQITSTYIHPLELDIVLLSVLRCAHSLLKREQVFNNLQSPSWSPLKSMTALIKNQVLVDEVTDFSPIQIACMSCLSHPKMQSFFACGDFNQRLTVWGTKSPQEFAWLFPDIELKEVSIAYRHSHQLNELAKAIICLFGGNSVELHEPKDMNNDCVAPVLAEYVKGTTEIARWLSERIVEIDRTVGSMPSTAVFVNTEDDVKPLTEELNAILEEQNLKAVACSDGNVMGHDTDVRVFDVQHIKGLEFEAVFFVSIDQLANIQPQLFDKYLYVGATRAATYLGITCEDSLPPSVEALRPHFVSGWDA